MKLDYKVIRSVITSRAEIVWARFNRLSPREKNIFGGALAVLSLALVYGGIFMPIHNHFKGFQDKIAVQEKQVLRNIRSVHEKPQVDSAYQTLLSKLDMPNASDDEIRDGMLKDVDQFARSNGLNLAEVKPQVSDEEKTFKKFYVRLQIEGRLRDLLVFFSDLVRTRRLYMIDSLRIIPSQEDVNKVKANVNLARAILRNN